MSLRSAMRVACQDMGDGVSFYFDFNSPYAWLAAERIDELVPGAEWKPIAFPLLLHQLGRLDEAMRRDPSGARGETVRRAGERGLPPFTPPEGWPLESWSLAPLRAAVFAGERGRAREFCLAAFRAMFTEGRSLVEMDNIREAAVAAGMDPDEVEEAIGRQDVKDRLKQNTDEALARGITGIPTVVVGDEPFWGDDHLEDAAAAAVRT